MAFKDQVSSLDRIATALERLADNLGSIPTPTESDAGKFLVVGEDGNWMLYSEENSQLELVDGSPKNESPETEQ